MILSVWLFLSILNLATFSQAFEKSKPDSSLYEDDVLKTVVQKLIEAEIKKLSLRIDNLDLIINQKCQNTKTMPNSKENRYLESLGGAPPNFVDIGKPKNPKSEISPFAEAGSVLISPLTAKASYIPSNCAEAMRLSGRPQGVHKIRIPGSPLEPIDVYCMPDTNGDGDAWTLIQRRINGSVDFQQPWVEYVRGFGNLEGEFWIGLEKIYELTKSVRQELWIQMEDFENGKRWIRYSGFNIGNATDSYALKFLGTNIKGNAGDSLRAQVDQKFSTNDNDNYEHKGYCAEIVTGGWWHKDCHHSNLNGDYLRGTYGNDLEGKGVVWLHWKGIKYSLKYVHMAIRPYIPESCNEAVGLSGRPEGIHKIRIPGSPLAPINVYCMSDPKGDGDAWTLIQRRLDGSVNFKKLWVDYAGGFGNLKGEFWLGLEKIHEMTKSQPHELWIQMETFDNVTGWAKYEGFSVGNKKEYFPLKISDGIFNGNVSDAMRYHVYQKFSTVDMDNDESKIYNCAKYGAWWHRACYLSNLNGRYLTPDKRRHGGGCTTGINWADLEGCSIKYVHMAIRSFKRLSSRF